MWFPNMAADIRKYIKDCFPCSISVPRNNPPTIFNRPLPVGPWKEVAFNFKGPIGGKSRFYYHVVINTYTHYPEIFIVPDTKFESLKP